MPLSSNGEDASLVSRKHEFDSRERLLKCLARGIRTLASEAGRMTFDSSAGHQHRHRSTIHRSLGWRSTVVPSKRDAPGSTPGRGAIPLRTFSRSDLAPPESFVFFTLSLTPKGWAPVYETGL